MRKPPRQRKRVSPIELHQEFNNGWEERLRACKRIDYYNQTTPLQSAQAPGTATVGYEYYENDTLVALVFYYRRPDDTLGASGKPSPKFLLIDGVYHYI